MHDSDEDEPEWLRRASIKLGSKPAPRPSAAGSEAAGARGELSGAERRALLSGEDADVQRVFLTVADSDHTVLARVESRGGGRVCLRRLHAPAGVGLALALPEASFKLLSAPARGDLSLASVGVGSRAADPRARWWHQHSPWAWGPWPPHDDSQSLLID